MYCLFIYMIIIITIIFNVSNAKDKSSMYYNGTVDDIFPNNIHNYLSNKYNQNSKWRKVFDEIVMASTKDYISKNPLVELDPILFQNSDKNLSKMRKENTLGYLNIGIYIIILSLSFKYWYIYHHLIIIINLSLSSHHHHHHHHMNIITSLSSYHYHLIIITIISLIKIF